MDFAEAYLMCKLGHPELAGWWGKLLGRGGGGKTFTIAPKQTGTGDPSPDNPRPIHPGLTLVRDDDSVLEVYGGTLDVLTGALTVTRVCHTLTGTEKWTLMTDKGYRRFIRSLSAMGWEPQDDSPMSPMSSHFAIRPKETRFTDEFGTFWISIDGYLGILDNKSAIRDREALNAWTKAQADPVQICYLLEEPETLQLTQAEVKRAVQALS